MGQRRKFLLCLICLFFVLLCGINSSKTASAYTLGDEWETIFKNDNFIFWNPYQNLRGQCDDFGEDDPYPPDDEDDCEGDECEEEPEPSEDVWDGHCSSVQAYVNNGRLEKFFGDVYSVAKMNGLPWEGMMAQMILESGLGAKEACPYNPLGLKSWKPYPPACDSHHHATFKNYMEAFQYYTDSIIRVREAKHKYPNNPYAYIVFLQSGSSKYATDEHYVNKATGIVCGLQKWAQATGRPVSSVTYDRYEGGSGKVLGGNSSDYSSSTDPDPRVHRRKDIECPEEEEEEEECQEVDENGICICTGDDCEDDEEEEADDDEEDDCEGDECEEKEPEPGCLTLSEGQALMNKYRAFSPRWVDSNPMLGSYYGISRTTSCTSDLENCVAFVKYYVKEKTGVTMSSLGNGSAVAGNLISRGWTNGGHTPKPGAVFSTGNGSTICGGGVLCGHTGVVIGISGDSIYIAEAGCSKPFSWTGIHTYSLSKYSSRSFTYAYPPGC